MWYINYADAWEHEVGEIYRITTIMLWHRLQRLTCFHFEWVRFIPINCKKKLFCLIFIYTLSIDVWSIINNIYYHIRRKTKIFANLKGIKKISKIFNRWTKNYFFKGLKSFKKNQIKSTKVDFNLCFIIIAICMHPLPFADLEIALLNKTSLVKKITSWRCCQLFTRPTDLVFSSLL